MNKPESKEDLENRFDKKFSNSDFWLDIESYPKNYNAVRRFIKEAIKETKEETEIFCESQYRDFIAEAKEELKKEFQKLIAKEIVIAQKEGQPTSRLTSLANKIK